MTEIEDLKRCKGELDHDLTQAWNHTSKGVDHGAKAFLTFVALVFMGLAAIALRGRKWMEADAKTAPRCVGCKNPEKKCHCGNLGYPA